MVPEEQNRSDQERPPDPGFLASQQNREKTVWFPWVIAAAVVVLGLGIVVLFGGHGTQETQPKNPGMSAADPYATSLALSDLQMSEAASFSGAKVTYVDGEITNNGKQTLTAITVQVGFHNDLGEYAQRLAEPLSLIRTREPYIDIQPVSANPIEPGQRREFRLIFDAVPGDWNQQYPEIRVIGVHTK